MVYDDRITKLCEEIAELVRPVRIIIFNEKHTPAGELISFKLCVVVKEGECIKTEQKIYLSLECELPFDVRVYTNEQWNNAIQDPETFAYRGILNGGVVLYESE
ncbi:MAG: hypothetical protein IJM51_09735 [Clostridia bacterium]|nr:hypothetical protein [Clostridia bacterium]